MWYCVWIWVKKHQLVLTSIQAANAFKVEKRWNESGQAFERYVCYRSVPMIGAVLT